MNTSPNTQFLGSASLFAFFVAISVPALIMGRAVLAVLVILALVALAADGRLRAAFGGVVNAARSPLGIMVMVTTLAWLPGALGSSFPIRSSEAVLRTPMLLGVAVLVFAAFQTDRRFQDQCLKVFVAASTVATAIAVISIVGLPELYWFIRLKGWRDITVHNELKAFAALSLFVVPVLACVAFRFRGVWAVTAAATSLGLIFLVWETYNRAAIAGFITACGCLTCAFLVRPKARRFALPVLVTVAVFCVAILLWLKGHRSHYVSFAPSEEWIFPLWLIDYQRQMIWNFVLGIAGQAPWFGIGANTINFTPGADQVITGTYDLHLVPGHPHNWFVEVLAEAGAVGLGMLLVTIATSFIMVLGRYYRSGELKYAMVAAIMGGYWGSGLFNFSYWSAWWHLAFYLSVCICLLADSDAPASASD